jgi:hypothetical protein
MSSILINAIRDVDVYFKEKGLNDYIQAEYYNEENVGCGDHIL